MVQMAGCDRRSPFSSMLAMSWARTDSYGRCPYVNSSHRVTPEWHTPQIDTHYSAVCTCFDAVCCAAGRASGLKKVSGGALRGYLSAAMCRLACGPPDATATHCLLLQWNPDWFYLSGTGSPGYSPGQRAVKRICACVCTLQVTF